MQSHRGRHGLTRAFVAVALIGGVITAGAAPSHAAEPAIGLATADNFAVLAGSGITNTGPTTITGDIGTFPTQTETGTGSITLTGTDHAGDAVTQQAKNDLVTAYGDAAGRGPTTQVATDLGGQTLAPGVYGSASGTFTNTGVLTLDGQNLTNPVFVLQTSSTLITGSASTVQLINGADACNVYWQVGSSATLGTGSSLTGTVMALTSITVTTGATLEGRALARNGAVTLDTNTITRASCAGASTSTSTTITSSTSPSVEGSPVTFTATVTAGDSSTPTGAVEFFDNGVSLGVVPLQGGTATLTTNALAAGDHAITAINLGGPGYASSTSVGLSQVVTAAPGGSGGPGSSIGTTAVDVTPTFTG